MKKLTIFGLLFFAFSCMQSKKMIHFQSSPIVNSDSIDVSFYEDKYGEYDAVYLFMNNSFEHIGDNMPGMYTKWIYNNISQSSYILLNPNNQDLTTFRIYIPTDDVIKNLILRVASPEGVKTNYTRKDLIREEDENGRPVLKFIYPDVKKGSIIEESYELSYIIPRHRPPLKYEVPVELFYPIEKLNFQFAYPSWWMVQFKKISEADSQFYSKRLLQDENKKIIEYSAENVPALKKEIYSPYFKEFAKYFEFMITYLEMGGIYNPPSSWQKIGEGYEDYAMHNEGFFSSKVDDTTKEVIANCDTKYEMLDAIITYIQANIEIMQDTKVDNFGDMIRYKRGNVLNINGLAQSMLTKTGIISSFILIHSAKDGYFDENYINYDQFTIPAVLASIKDRDYIVFPYIKNMPVDYIPPHVQGQPALSINDEGNTTHYTVPNQSYTKNKVDEKYNLILNPDGSITVTEEKKFYGSSAISTRELLSEMKDEEKEKFMEDILTYHDGDIEIESYILLNEKKYKQPLTIVLQYKIENLLTITPEEIIFQTGGLFSPSSLKQYKIDTKKRVTPIKVYFDEYYTKTIEIEIPEKWNLTSKLSNFKFNNQFGIVQAKYKKQDNKLIILQGRYLNQIEAPRESIKEFLEINGEFSKLNIPTLVFEVNQE